MPITSGEAGGDQRLRNLLAELERTQRQGATLLKIKAEGWQVLSDAQSAPAHCVVMYYVKSAKLEFNFKAQ